MQRNTKDYSEATKIMISVFLKVAKSFPRLLKVIVFTSKSQLLRQNWELNKVIISLKLSTLFPYCCVGFNDFKQTGQSYNKQDPNKEIINSESKQNVLMQERARQFNPDCSYNWDFTG